jgi:isocitrate/isopropylmalate dehydrogenase
MLLQYIGEAAVAERLRQAILDCIAHQAVTPDLGGTLTTEQVTDRVLSALEIVPERK